MSLSCRDRTTQAEAPIVASSTGVQRSEKPNNGPGEDTGRYAPKQVLVTFRAETDRQAVQAIEKELGLRSVRVILRSNTYVMEIMNGVSVEDMVERLKALKAVEYAEPNYIRSIQ